MEPENNPARRRCKTGDDLRIDKNIVVCIKRIHGRKVTLEVHSPFPSLEVEVITLEKKKKTVAEARVLRALANRRAQEQGEALYYLRPLSKWGAKAKKPFFP